MAAIIKTIFQLDSKPSFFESIVARSSGALLISRQDIGELWEVDPTTGTGKCIVTIPEVASLTGLTEISHDVFAIGAGIYRLANHEGTVPGSYSVWVINLNGASPVVHLAAKTPEIGQLNGITAWDSETILAADSYYGKIYRISLVDGSSNVCLEDDTMNDPPISPVKMGVNGIRIRHVDGTKYVYYSNTTRMIYCRVPVNESITAIEKPEVISVGFIPQSHATGTAFESIAFASIPTNIANPDSLPSPSALFMPDDFCFAEDGSTYATTHPTNMVVKIPPTGGQVVRIAGGMTSWETAGATACTFGRSEIDKNTLYVVTAGANVMPINGQTEPAKLIAIELDN